MRISGWFIGLISFFVLVAATIACSVLSFSTMRTVTVDLWDSGVQVGSIEQSVQGILNPSAFDEAATEVADAASPFDSPDSTGEVSVVIASVTPDAPLTEPPADIANDNAAIDDNMADGQTVAMASTPTATQSSGISSSIAQPTNANTDAGSASQVDAAADAIATIDPDAPEVESWNDPRQIRILLMGIDQRTFVNETVAPAKTDTMIVVNVDPIRKTAGLISFPRDLWVSIPNFLPARLNTANSRGEESNYPGGGGPALAMETINANFGIPVQYFIMVNFDVFERVVNLIAPQGVEICVDQEIRDPKYPDEGYGTINVEFDPGCQRLDGTRLLQYARTRSTEGGDFDRARRQQQTLDALRAELLSAGGIRNFIAQIPALWAELSGSYRTNLTLEQIIQLGGLITEIPRDSISFAVVDADYVNFGLSPDGTQEVLFPNTSRINDLIQRVFYPQIEVTEADLLTRSNAENASIYVYNGTDISGLATRTQEWLTGRGVTVSSVGNLPDIGNEPTTIRYYNGERWTAQYMAQLLGLPPERIAPGTDGVVATGVVVVAGPDIETVLGQ